MKIFLFLTLAASAGHLLAESAIPEAYSRERYDETVVTSPFALATPKEDKGEEAPPPVNALTNLYVVALSQQDGQDFVLVQNPGDLHAIKLVGNTPYNDETDATNPNNGIYVEKVNWTDRWNGVTVVLRQGNNNRRDDVKFKEIAAATMGQPGMPGMPNGAGSRFARPGGAPGGPAASLIPSALLKAAPAQGNFQNGGRNLPGGQQRGGNGVRGAGTQNIGPGGNVPRPGGGFNRGNNGAGANPVSAPNTGPSRTTRDRGQIRNGGR